jgi:5-methylcytosine-specific restriction endonuclease McrA
MGGTLMVRGQAAARGNKYYFTGVACVNGHVDRRLTVDGHCLTCNRQRASRAYALNPEPRREQSRRWRLANPEKARAISRAWQKANPERYRELRRKASKKWRSANPAAAAKACREWYARNVDGQRKRVSAWKKANREAVRLAARKRYATREDVRRKKAAGRDRWRALNKQRAREINRASSKRQRINNADGLRAAYKKWRLANLPKLAAKQAKRRQRIRTVSLSSNDKREISSIYAKCAALSASSGVQHHVDHIVPLARGGRHHPSNLQIITATENQRKGAR